MKNRADTIITKEAPKTRDATILAYIDVLRYMKRHCIKYIVKFGCERFFSYGSYQLWVALMATMLGCLIFGLSGEKESTTFLIFAIIIALPIATMIILLGSFALRKAINRIDYRVSTEKFNRDEVPPYGKIETMEIEIGEDSSLSFTVYFSSGRRLYL